jgi:hypothetical protein
MSSGTYQLYKSDLRGTIEGNLRRSFFTFNEGNYFDQSRRSIEPLQQFAEHYLYRPRRLELVSENSSWILIPIEGALQIINDGNSWVAAPQDILILSTDQPVCIENTESTETSRFYMIQIGMAVLPTGLSSYDPELRNRLIPLMTSKQFQLTIGIFDGRKECEIKFLKPRVFVSIIHGAFEVQNRLMETNDCLLITNDDCIEFEALSENAIILIFSF